MTARTLRPLMAAAWVVAQGCGGGESSSPPPRPAASAASPAAPARTAPSAESSSRSDQARQKFAALSRDLEKLGKGEAVDAAWLAGQLRAVLALDPGMPAARFDLAILQERGGDAAGARRAIDDIVGDSPEFAPAQENLAARLAAEGRRDDAIAIYRRVIEREPKDVTGRLALARLMAEDRQYAEAIALARKALQYQGDAIEAFRVLAKSYEAEGNVPMAELIIGRGLKLSKDDTELRYLAAKILLDKGNLADGVKQLKEIVALDPKWLKVRGELATIALQYRDFGNAAQQLEAILKEEPGNLAARVDLGVSYKGMGRFEPAEKMYREVLAKDANQPSALWNLAVLYHRHLGRYDDAIAAYQRFEDVAPRGDEKAGEVDKLVADIQKQKSDLAATKAREERERQKREAVAAACAAVGAGRRPNAEAIGNDQERTEAAWQLMTQAQQSLQDAGAELAQVVPGAESNVKCAFAITPDTNSARTEACAPMRVMWTQILYQLGRLDDAMVTILEGRKCDPNNPDAQLIEQQLKEIIAQQKGQAAGSAAPASTGAQQAPEKQPPARGARKRRGK